MIAKSENPITLLGFVTVRSGPVGRVRTATCVRGGDTRLMLWGPFVAADVSVLERGEKPKCYIRVRLVWTDVTADRFQSFLFPHSSFTLQVLSHSIPSHLCLFVSPLLPDTTARPPPSFPKINKAYCFFFCSIDPVRGFVVLTSVPVDLNQQKKAGQRGQLTTNDGVWTAASRRCGLVRRGKVALNLQFKHKTCSY